ncbi:hypothetical protein Q5752_002460 [Cryptotrichosporon argae]
MPSPGSGHVHLTASGLSTSSASYPLKLLSPRPLPSQPPSLRCVYTLAYGGGLVAGDAISLSASVEAGCRLVLLTQGSTKVFKHRPGSRVRLSSDPRGAAGEDETTRQRLLVDLQPGALLLLLPDPASPFRAARFKQAQRIVVPRAPDGKGPAASALVLDWVNSGRGARRVGRLPRPNDVGARNAAGSEGGVGAGTGTGKGTGGEADEDAEAEVDAETWAFEHYASTNEILVGDELVMRERMVLDASPPALPLPSASTSSATLTSTSAAPPLSALAHRLAPYNVYATLLVLGPQLAPLLAHLAALADGTSQFQRPRPPALVWSFSPLALGAGVVRVAAVEVEDARTWIRRTLEGGGVNELVGDGLWPRCI